MSTNSSFIKIGIIGKPSCGKSTLLNAIADANAKTGNYPFTTIEPNHGTALYKASIPCPCAEYGLQKYCKPKYGKCANSVRYIPISVMDVAGLVPGASLGKGLGNKFLDDLRHAHVLIHVLDVSGTTNEKGENCEGYDPINDIEWLEKEIHDWIFNNLWSRWDSIVRKHRQCKNTITETFSQQLSGYGCNRKFIVSFCDHLARTMTQLIDDNVNEEEKRNLYSKHIKPLDKWSEEDLHAFVSIFVSFRFPTLYALNKIDHKASSKYINKFYEKYDNDRIVLTSALAECFLKNMRKKGYIFYNEGDSEVKTFEDFEENDEERKLLKPITDQKNLQILQNIKDFVLARFDSTGVTEAIKKAVDLQEPVIIYPVNQNITQLSEHMKDREDVEDVRVFEDVALMRYGSSVKSFVSKFYRSIIPTEQQIISESGKPMLPPYFVEGIDGRRLAEHHLFKKDCNNIIRVVFTGN
ncbi:hypothetical protein FDP41_007072 [Naegleria fowleri]|uniref:OBG-type G domain-containing protein n=1 Tax=Naegleria fowleri TaxID=5763 RepID=A0A6A5BIZ2_NAEFO|nr:uncharacterized protein FDP41_007072 [Naegleria fowleri]KAF0973685.1 hypothetical protein FDP41_007072 [Naegleria fowleri]